MARAILEHVVQDTDGDVQGSASVYVYEEDGTTLLAQAMYAANSGGSPLSNPLTADSRGFLKAYTPLAQRVVVKVNGVSYPSAFEPDPEQLVPRSEMPLNAKALDYSAQGDGVSNDTAALQALINAQSSAVSLVIPSGTYIITSALTIANKTRVRIRGEGGTIIQQTTVGAKGLVITGASDVVIEDLELQGPGTAEETANVAQTEYGIHASSGTEVTVRNCKVTGFGYKGIHSDATISTIVGNKVTGTGNTSASNSNCTGITTFGVRSEILNNRVDNCSNGIGVQGSGQSKVMGNWVNQSTRATNINTAAYINSPYIMAQGNHFYASSKVAFTANYFNITGNVFNGSGGFTITHTSGGQCSHNTIEGGSILLTVDDGGSGNDSALCPYGLMIHGNHIRRSPTTDAGSGIFTGAITLANRCRNVVIENNIIEYSAAHGIVAYDAAAIGFDNLTIRHNTIRRGSTSSSGTYSAIKLGYGFSTENLAGLRIYGNTVESLASTTSANAVSTNGSVVVTLTSSAECDKFTPGDYVSGIGLAAGAYLVEVARVAKTLTVATGYAASGGSVGTGTLTRANMKFKYALDLTQANNASGAQAVEIRDDNNWGAASDYGTGLVGYGGTGIIRRDTLTLRHSGVAHGMTSLTDTDAFGVASTISATDGGILVQGLTETTIAYQVEADATTETATRSTAADAAIVLAGWKKNGTSSAAMTADRNILAVKTGSTTQFILDSDGDSHQNAGRTLRAAGGAGDDIGVGWTNYDSVDDIQALNALAISLAQEGDPLRSQFLQFFEESREYLAGIPGKPIVTFNDGPDGDGGAFVNMSRLTMLAVGAIRQLAGQVRTLEIEAARLRALVLPEAP